MIGTTISHYSLVKKLGIGGMGEVHEAEDLKLHRRVALKFLPENLVKDRVALARFQREALALSALNHANICTIYEIDECAGLPFIAMELLQGKPLSQVIAGKPLPNEEIISLGVEITDALSTAHGHGVVHRDIKPANIFVTDCGHAKLLDFGLAKLMPQQQKLGQEVAAGVTASTFASADMLSAPGGVAGTISYMSPEQARGQDLDTRTDLFSLGATLYEMATGVMAFHGNSLAETFDSILNRQPEPIMKVNEEIPPPLQEITEKCLEKDRCLRYQTAAEIRTDLLRLKRDSNLTTIKVPGRGLQKPLLRALLVLFTALPFLAVGWFVHSYNPSSERSSTEWTPITNFPDSATSPALSSDGRMLAFIRGPSTFAGQGEIYVKLMPDGDPVQLTRDGLSKMSPVFSPEGSLIAYTVPLKWDTWTVPILSGVPTLMLPNASGLTWIGRQRLLFSEIKSGMHMALVTSSENRSEERDIYIPRHERGMVHRSALSPDGKLVLLAEMENNGWLPCRSVSFSSPADTRVVGPPGSCTGVAWSPDGRWMYFSADLGIGFHIWRQRFPDGQPEQVTRGPNQEEGIAMAPDGKSFLTSVGIEEKSVWVHDSQGDRRISPEGSASSVSFSPDGRKVYYIAHSHGGSDFPLQGELCAVDLGNNQSERVLPGFPVLDYTVASNGKQAVVSFHGKDGIPHLWLASLDRRNPPRQMTSSAGEDRPHFAPNGDIFFRQKEGHTNFLYRMKEDGSQKQSASPYPISELLDVSPDGKWALTLAAVDDKELPFATVALPVGRSGPLIRICHVGCIAGWSRNGNIFYVEMRNAARDKQAGKTLVFSLRGSPSGLPVLPRYGIDFDDLNAVQSVTTLPYVISPGPDPSVYAFSQKSVHRNIYRVPIP